MKECPYYHLLPESEYDIVLRIRDYSTNIQEEDPDFWICTSREKDFTIYIYSDYVTLVYLDKDGCLVREQSEYDEPFETAIPKLLQYMKLHRQLDSELVSE